MTRLKTSTGATTPSRSPFDPHDVFDEGTPGISLFVSCDLGQNPAGRIIGRHGWRANLPDGTKVTGDSRRITPQRPSDQLSWEDIKAQTNLLDVAAALEWCRHAGYTRPTLWIQYIAVVDWLTGKLPGPDWLQLLLRTARTTCQELACRVHYLPAAVVYQHDLYGTIIERLEVGR